MNSKQKSGRFGLLWNISRGSRVLYLIAAAFMAMSIFASYVLPQIIMFVVDCIVGGLPMTQPAFVQDMVARLGGVGYFRAHIPLVAVLMLAVAALGGLANFVRGRMLAMSSEGTIKRLRDKLYAHIQSLPYEWHVKIQTGDIIQRCTSDVDVVRNFIANQLIEIVRTLLLVVFAYSILFPMNFNMALASLVFLPVILSYSFIFLRMVAHRYLQADEAEGLLLSIAQENLTGVRVVRAFGREKREVDRFREQNNLFSNLWMNLGQLLSVFWGMGDLITGLQMVTICVVGAFEAAKGNLSAGGFIVFLTYNSMTIWPVRGLGRTLSEASKTSVSLGRLQEILNTPPEADEPGALEIPIRGKIEFKNVSFAYDNQTVLKNISFTLEQGETLGVLGGTGSGKTTLAHLLCRLYDLPEHSGEITIDGVNIRQYKRKWLRQHVGIVLQEPFLYSRSIRDNIAALSPCHSGAEIRQAARISCVDEAIEQFSSGYDTVVGERGVTLSGGQKQRVAIARTILKDCPITIFDDSLSAVDTETDAKIRFALSKRTSSATTIIIAHRITSLCRADKVIVLENGHILEQGDHESLLAQNGVYRRVYDMQESLTVD